MCSVQSESRSLETLPGARGPELQDFISGSLEVQDNFSKSLRIRGSWVPKDLLSI